MLMSLMQSLGVVATMLEMIGTEVSGVHVRLAGVVCGLVVVQSWPGRPLSPQISVTALFGHVVTSLDGSPVTASVCEDECGLMMVSEAANPSEESTWKALPFPLLSWLF